MRSSQATAASGRVSLPDLRICRVSLSLIHILPDPADAVTHAEAEEPAAPEVPKAEKEQELPPVPGKDAPAPAHSGKVLNFAAARDEAAKEEKKAVKQKPPTEKDKAAKPGRGRPSKDGKAAPDKAKPPKPRDKKSQSKPIPGEACRG